jgi:CIC family chloride channel protein
MSLRRIQATKLILLPCLTGVLTGVGTIGFVELINLVQWLAIGSTDWPLRTIPHLHWARVLLVPMIGGLIVGPLVRFFAPEAEGHGVPEVIEAVMMRGGRIRKRVATVKSLASALTIGTGGSVGREGPVVQIGAALGSTLGQLLRLPAEQIKTLAACGAAGGIAAVFNAPIAEAFFALEVITGNFAMPAFGPVILSSVLATVVSRAYFGDHPAFIVQPYELASVVEIVAYMGLGLFCGIVAVAFVWTMDRFETLAPRLPVPKQWRPAVGGVVLGALILVLPYLYGVGYGTMDAALSGRLSWHLLALLIPAKIIATSLTLASGGSGGVFLPALYIGSVAGGLYGVAVQYLLGSLAAGSGAYALVGMAGVLAAATHSPITAMILLFEVTGDYKIILPVMIVVTLATLIGRALKEDSLYTLKLSRQGIALHRREDIIMRSHTVGAVMRPAEWVIGDGTPLGDIIQCFLQHAVISAYVTDRDDHLVGAISIHDIKDPAVAELGPLVVASEIAERNVQSLNPGDTLAECMDRFVLSEAGELPVVDSSGKLVGVVSRRDVLRVYSTELLRHEYLGAATRDDRGTGAARSLRLPPELSIVRVPTPSWLAGRSLREANLRVTHNLTVVAVQHGGHGEDQLPEPEVPLAAQDILVVVGRPADIEQFRGPMVRGTASLVLVVVMAACLACTALPATAREAPRRSVPLAGGSGCEVRDSVLIHGQRESHDIALTFDACPTRHVPGFAPEIVDELVKAEVPATFFISGKWAESHPENLRMLAAVPFFAIALHGYRHHRLNGAAPATILGEIEDGRAALEKLGVRPQALFRPPFGDRPPGLAALAYRAGVTAVLWDVAPGDPSPNETAAAIERDVLRQAHGGSIIVLHVNGRGVGTAAAVPHLVTRLRERGFRFVTVEELVRQCGADSSRGGQSRSDP